MPSYRVRLCSHFGSYPSGDVRLGSDLLIRSGQHLYICTENIIEELRGQCTVQQPAFELDNWTLPEIRMLGSLVLGNGRYASVRPYALPAHTDLFLRDCEQIAEDAHLLKYLLNKADDGYLMRNNSGSLPTNFSSYSLVDWDNDKHAQAQKVWERIDITNAPLMRGVHSLLKSLMLNAHFQFGDSALCMSHVALDAAFACVVRVLKSKGLKSPSSKDAQRYVEELVGYEPTGQHFFEEYYRDRVRNFHTDSKYGAEPIPFFSVDDLWELNEHLRAVFYALITGELDDDTKKEMEEYQRDREVRRNNDRAELAKIDSRRQS